MDFLIPAGSATNLPKEMIDEVVNLAIEKAKLYKLIANRDQNKEIVNEGTLPVLGAADVTKVFYVQGTADITDLAEQAFDIITPDLVPKELGNYFYLKAKHIKQYTTLDAEAVYKNKLAEAMSRVVDKIVTSGDTTATGTSALQVGNGLYTIAAGGAGVCNTTPQSFATSNAQTILNTVTDGIEELGEYGSEDYADDLFILGSSTFMSSVRKSADRDYIGYSIEPCEELGLKKCVHLHGIPVLRRTNISGEKAVLFNARGAYAGYYGDQMAVDVSWKPARRSYLSVLTFWFDFQWAFLDSSAKADGLVLIQKSS